MPFPITPHANPPAGATGYAVRSPYGLLRLNGRDRLDFLHRLSTNDFRGLEPPHGLPAVLASPVGRVKALVLVGARPEALMLRVEAEQADTLLHYFNSMIFWQDDVQVADLTGETQAITLYGDGWLPHLGDLRFAAAGDLPPYGWLDGEIGGKPVTLVRGGELEPADWTLVAQEGLGEIAASLAQHAPQLDAATLERMWIEHGLPRWGRELSEEVTPLEANLLPAISFSKGCYVGQEVIARQVNYDKVTRRLVGLMLDPGAPEGLAGATIAGPGRGGRVTSSVFSPRAGAVVALALLPRDLAEPGTRVTVTQGEIGYDARVSALPFA
jgi:folate-binding protein YgfZ